MEMCVGSKNVRHLINDVLANISSPIEMVIGLFEVCTRQLIFDHQSCSELRFVVSQCFFVFIMSSAAVYIVHLINNIGIHIDLPIRYSILILYVLCCLHLQYYSIDLDFFITYPKTF